MTYLRSTPTYLQKTTILKDNGSKKVFQARDVRFFSASFEGFLVSILSSGDVDNFFNHVVCKIRAVCVVL
jgi:hypothetical protein